ncbi:hypothetical protein HJFPF1_00007 [Paramyrothecium foliicola]|nr:hypothetical protein HJFPF1_00007 [Paramyrothecium foliicola]
MNSCHIQLSSAYPPPSDWASPSLYSQGQSDVFGRLPPEVRRMIYCCLFSSTRLVLGKRFITEKTYVRVRSPPNSLALLRSCHRAYDEIADSWTGLVLFHIEDVATLLEKFSLLPSMMLAKIRHMRIVAADAPLVAPGECLNSYDFKVGLLDALSYLTGLCLNTLTVYWPVPRPESFFISTKSPLMKLITHGRGWRRLHFVSQSSKLNAVTTENCISMTLKTWARGVKHVDGTTTSVFTAWLNSTQKSTHPRVHGKQIMVVVERDAGADCEQQLSQRSDSLICQIFDLHFARSSTWRHFLYHMYHKHHKEEIIEVEPEMNSCDIDDYVWTSNVPDDPLDQQGPGTFDFFQNCCILDYYGNRTHWDRQTERLLRASTWEKFL